jgi:fructokinase
MRETVNRQLLAGVETGGTKIVCAVAESPDQILDHSSFPTGTDPQAAMSTAAAYFDEKSSELDAQLIGVGIASFGPCDPEPNSSTYGYVTSTPKPGWANAGIIELFGKARAALGGAEVPVGFDTDVGAAALGEATYGAGRGLADLIYLTIGTGIGGGAVVNGATLHGLIHPEMGHMLIPRTAAEIAEFAGVCPYHGDCWEGIAAGPAIQARWGRPGQELPDDHPAWALEADYVAAGLHNLVLTLSPQQIILGGGVGSSAQVLSLVQTKLVASLANYVDSARIKDDITSYVVSPGLGDFAGVTGALELARLAAIAAPTS